jgi:hypothetical protein
MEGYSGKAFEIASKHKGSFFKVIPRYVGGSNRLRHAVSNSIKISVAAVENALYDLMGDLRKTGMEERPFFPWLRSADET